MRADCIPHVSMSRLFFLCAMLLPQCAARCSVAEQKCGPLCCCVTCKCLEGPYRCEDMWGKPTDPAGTEDDERFATPEWSQARHEEHLERHREFMEQHKERMEKRRADREERRARGENVEDENDFGRAEHAALERGGHRKHRRGRADARAARAAAFGGIGDPEGDLTAEEYEKARQEL